MDLQTVLSILSLLGIGSILSQYLGKGGERQVARGKALEAFRLVEQARWVSSGERKFPEVMRTFEVAAMVARVPRKATKFYEALAYAAFWESSEMFEAEGDPALGGSIESGFADSVNAAASLVVDLIWRPWLGRYRLNKRIANIEKQTNMHSGRGSKERWHMARKNRPT